MTYCYVVLTMSAVSLVTSISTKATPFQTALMNNHTIKESITIVIQVEKFKNQILRGLNLTSEPIPTPSTSDRPQVSSVVSPSSAHGYHPFSYPVPLPLWAEPVDTEDKTPGDQLLFRVSSQEKKAKVINRATLVIQLRAKSLPKDLPQQDIPYTSKRSDQDDLKRQNKRKTLRLLTLSKPQQVLSPGKDKQQGAKVKTEDEQNRKNRRRRRKNKQRHQHVKVQVQALNEDGKFQRVTVQRVTVSKKMQWINIQIPASIVARAAQSPNRTLVLKVRCKRCHQQHVFMESVFPRGRNRRKDSQAVSEEDLNPNRPYLIIKNTDPPPVDPAPSKRVTREAEGVFCPARVRRSRNATPCCAERMYVTFRDFGWDRWIVYPPGFSTVVCLGMCDGGTSSPGALTQPDWDESAGSSSAPDSALASSCQPTKRSSLTLLYQRDTKGLVLGTIPDLINHSCACLAT